MDIKESVRDFFYSSEDKEPPEEFFSGIGIGEGIIYFGSEAMVVKPTSPPD
ncbi:hypothetical protein [Halomonas sp. MS1]|nr:hypothetical protein [Halomonas sp. MS1]UTD55534.1 hypothetical protein NF683_20730 [Halomonas sp. MS1]